MAEIRAKGTPQKKGRVPRPLPRVGKANGGHIWRPHGTELPHGWVPWIRRLGAPTASAEVHYPDSVVILAASKRGVKKVDAVGDVGGTTYFAVLMTDWRGNGGLRAIIRGNHEGLGEKPE